MLRRLGIRAKVLAVLAVPMLVLLGAGVYVSYGAISDYRYASASEGAIRSGEQLIEYTDALMAERIGALTGVSGGDLDADFAATDKARQTWVDVVGTLKQDEFPASVRSALDASVNAGDKNTKSARGLLDDRRTLIQAYDAAIAPQMQVGQTFADVLQNREVAAYLIAVNQLASLSDDLVAELIDGVALPTSIIPEADAQAYANAAAQTEVARAAARAALYSFDDEDLVLPASDPSASFGNDRTELETGDPDAFQLVDFDAYSKDIQTQLATIDTVQKAAVAKASAEASIAADDARNRAFVTILLALLAAVLSSVVALTVARAIVNPLRRLTRAAADVRDELPRLVEQVAIPGEGPEITLEPIPVRSRDEVGRLAEAFNAVNATTVQVAQEQAALRGSIAEMFVNVARRDQVLLNRQLAFIDSLERAEEDPSTLANLFRLDHLATRMRRNAESLLVLAGIDTGRRLRDTMPLSDVIRTASSEIEQYDRVELDLQVDPPMLGFNALGSAHMLAELLENATIFSEPETPVTVTTGISGSSVVVRIVDHGLGMTDAEIEAANAKIISTSAGDALGAQRLGLFVVGRIAQRLGAEVRLAKSGRGTGTETIVRFPATLFASTEASPYGAGPGISALSPVEELPAVEAPVVSEVDLAALTDGQTTQGLPRRRRGDSDEDTTSGEIPLPAVAGASGLPTRPRKTFDEDAIVLPDAVAPTLSPDLSSGAADWTPDVVVPAAGSGLPSRSRAATSAWQSPEPAADASPTPASPAARAGLFSGFRGRSDLADTPVTPEGDDAAQSLVRAPWMALGGAHAAPVEPVVVPALADDDEWTPASAEPAAAADTASAEPVWVPAFADEAETAAPAAPQDDEAGADTDVDAAPVEPAQDAVPAWVPSFALAEPDGAELVADEPVADEPVAIEPDEAPADAVAWDEASTAPAVAAEPASDEAAPLWAPSFAPDAAVLDGPVAQDEPVAEALPAWEPAFVTDVAAQDEPVAQDEDAAEAAPAWEPTFVADAAALDEPVALDEPAAPDEPVAEAAPAWEPTFVADAAALDEPVAEAAPAWEPTFVADVAALDEAVAQDEPVAEAAPAWEPTFLADTAAQDEPAAQDEDAAEAAPAWEPTFVAEPAAQDEPIWTPSFAAAQDESPLVGREPVAREDLDAPAEPAWAPLLDVHDDVVVPAPQPAPEAETFLPAVVDEVAEQPAVLDVVEPAVEDAEEQQFAEAQQVAEVAASFATDADEDEDEAPVAEAAWPARPSTFTGYSGYAGWAGSSPRGTVGAPLTGTDFERSLDEARAWHTGAIPVVTHGADARAVAAASASIPVVDPVALSWAAPQAPVPPVADEAAVADATAEPVADETAWPVATWEVPSWEPPTWQTPAWEAQDASEPAAATEPAAAAEAAVVEQALEVPQLAAEDESVAQAAPAWPTPQTAQSDVESPTQLFSPVETAAAEQVVVQEAQVEAAEAQPEIPAWASSAASSEAPAASFGDLVAAEPADSGKKKRRGLFSRRKDDKASPVDTYTPVPPVPEQALPVRTSAWSAEQPAAEALEAWQAPAWQAPAPVAPAAPAPAVPAAAAPMPVRTPQAYVPQGFAPEAAAPPAPAPVASWTPPEWTGGPAGQPAISTVPHPAVPPTSAPRVGTLDDEVAAMLALRSDIQEQALAELSQLSTYRPSAVRQSERLTKRVPTAVPSEEPAAPAESASAPRDAEQLRSRLSSFQSGSARGRRAAGEPDTEGQQP